MIPNATAEGSLQPAVQNSVDEEERDSLQRQPCSGQAANTEETRATVQDQSSRRLTEKAATTETLEGALQDQSSSISRPQRPFISRGLQGTFLELPLASEEQVARSQEIVNSWDLQDAMPPQLSSESPDARERLAKSRYEDQVENSAAPANKVSIMSRWLRATVADR